VTAAFLRLSACVDQRRLRLLGLALVSAAVLTQTACGGGDSRREQVEQFVQDANAVQSRSGPAFDRANRTYANFSRGRLAVQDAQVQLAAAERAMRRTRDDIAALNAPKDARELQRRLVRLYDADASLAHESTLLAVFVPASAKAMSSLSGIGKDLTRQLRAAATAPGQIGALRRYAARVERVINRLQPLHPPPLLLDRHHRQIQHLVDVRTLSLQLVAGLRAQNRQRVARLLLRFRKLNSQTSSTPLAADALDAYNRRYLGIRRKLQSVERERARLERTLR
jgi:hypothetical protein